MAPMAGGARRVALGAVAGCLAFGALAASAGAADSVTWMKGFNDPDTPNRLDNVGVLKIGPSKAKNVLVLNPGTSSSSAYFASLAKTVVKAGKGWQVWAVERRENQLEDQTVADELKAGTATPQDAFDYYLGWLTDNTITPHFEPVQDADVLFARGWGMKVEINDLRAVVEAAEKHNRSVVVGGHSLGGSITTAYATWDFNGKPGVKGLSGLVYIDGGSNPTPVTPQQAQTSLNALQSSTPWLAFGGIPAPFLGLFGSGGALLAREAPNEPAIAQDFPLLPANLKPPVPVTNEALFGYGVDTDSSPPNLVAAQVHAGGLAATGDPRPWDQDTDITPLQRYATMLSGGDHQGVDGAAWYHPTRLTIDAGAVGNGKRNPAQQVLGVKATHGDDVNVPIYAFGAALGGQNVLDDASALAQRSHLPKRKLTLVNREDTYAHNDPAAAAPDNDFVKRLIPFLKKAAKR
jgi:pimeloyl-ACP methyl ester carboxylesterase